VVRSLQPGRIEANVHTILAGMSVGLLSLVLWQNRNTIHEVLGQRHDLRLLGLAFLISQVSLLITFVRWLILVRVIEPKFTLRSSILLGFIGYVFNLVIPGAVGGDVIKVAFLARMHVKKTALVASMVIDRMLGLLGLFVLAAMAGVLYWGLAPPKVRVLIVAVLGALGLGIVLLVALFHPAMPRIFPGLVGSRRGRLSMIMAELNATTTNYRRRLDVLLTGLGLSVIGHGLNVVVFFLIGKMLFSSRMTTTLGQHFLMAPLTFLTMAVPLPFGALGLTEEVGGQLFNLVGHPSGAVAMMGVRILMLASGIECACVYLVNLNEMRALTASAHLPSSPGHSGHSRAWHP
jgi:glycosyltransferase 2 family protein